MKNIIICLLLLTFIAGCNLFNNNQAGWFTVLSESNVSFNDDKYQGMTVTNLFFLNKNKGWATGRVKRDAPDKGYIAFTDDGGQNWKFKFLENYPRGGDPHFFNKKKGIIAMRVILTTENGGNSWDVRYIREEDPDYGISNIEFVDEIVGWGSGPFGAIAKTIDSGDTWNYLDTGYDEQRFGSISIADNSVWILGELDPGLLIRTDDGGESWNEVEMPYRGEDEPYVRLSEVHFINASEGWIAGDYRHIFYTSDGGETWELQYPKTQDQIEPDAIYAIDSFDENNLFALTSAGSFLNSKNGGESWKVQTGEPNNGPNNEIQFVSQNVVYAIVGGKLMKTVTRGEE